MITYFKSDACGSCKSLENWLEKDIFPKQGKDWLVVKNNPTKEELIKNRISFYPTFKIDSINYVGKAEIEKGLETYFESEKKKLIR